MLAKSRLKDTCALLDRQLGQRWCIFLVSPHAGHLHSSVTSFRALPAICLCLFFECDVFFFGTALSIPSQMPSRRDGIEGRPSWNAAGTARERDGRKGRAVRRNGIWGSLYAENRAGERSRGRREELVKAILIAGVAIAMSSELCRLSVLS